MPLTLPLAAFTVATPVLLLLHMPLGVLLASTLAPPIQMVVVPVFAPSDDATVTEAVSTLDPTE
jgi:hypothetical protein